jgi:hypothetical protein
MAEIGPMVCGALEIWATAISTNEPALKSRFKAPNWAPSLAADSARKLSQRNSTKGQGCTDSSNLLTIRLFQRMPEVRKARRKVAVEASAATSAWVWHAGQTACTSVTRSAM